MLRLLTLPSSHGGLSTELSEQLPTQGTSVHREMGEDMPAEDVTEPPTSGGTHRATSILGNLCWEYIQGT